LACRDIKINTCKKKLKDLAGERVSLDKYMTKLNLAKTILQLNFQSDVNFNTMDAIFGGDNLAGKAEDLLARYIRSGKSVGTINILAYSCVCVESMIVLVLIKLCVCFVPYLYIYTV
jgi:hypothetical protein